MDVARVMAPRADADELRQLRDAIRGVIAPSEDGTAVDAIGWRDSWQSLAALGAVALCVPEARGGYGLATEAAIAVAQELGAALHGSPYPGLVASTHALAAGGDTTEPQLADLVHGRSVIAFGELSVFGTKLELAAPRGIARLVDGAQTADAFLLAVPASRELLLIDAMSCRVEPPSLQFDETRLCGDVVLEGEPAMTIASDHIAPELFRLLLAADALGGLQRMLERTVQYAADRNAFGRPIGGFQAVQHRLVDHTVRVRGMQLVVTEARARWPKTPTRPRAPSRWPNSE